MYEIKNSYDNNLDAPDSIAGLLMNVLGKRAGNKLKLYDITKAGY